MEAFEKLCELASKERWCWKLACGTCGHEEFRRAWPLLIRGYSPGSPAWRAARAYVISPIAELSELDKETLSRVVARSRVSVLRRFPVWLPALGLVLYYTSSIELTSRRLTKWGLPQLNELVGSEDQLQLPRGAILEPHHMGYFDDRIRRAMREPPGC